MKDDVDIDELLTENRRLRHLINWILETHSPGATKAEIQARYDDIRTVPSEALPSAPGGSQAQPPGECGTVRLILTLKVEQ